MAAPGVASGSGEMPMELLGASGDALGHGKESNQAKALAAEAAAECPKMEHKKGAAVAGGSKVNREASNRVDRSHSMSRRWTIL